MARLRQMNPSNYTTNSRINDEFESVIRYLNTAELGDKTIAELLSQLFDSSGVWDGPIEFRVDNSAGLQVRVGNYEKAEEGWQTLADINALRGPGGQNVGQLIGPFFYNRIDYVATAGQTAFTYNFDASTDTVVVYRGGALQATTAYTTSPSTNTVTLASAASANEKITIYSLRTTTVANFRRSDQSATSNQSVFPFAHTAEEQLLVFRNGLVQREGALYDYTTSTVTGQVIFNLSMNVNDKITIMTVENTQLKSVGGLMLEDEYTNNAGKILWSKILVANDEITQNKVVGLASFIADGGQVFLGSSAPATPTYKKLWIDTSGASGTAAILKFYDGTQWFAANPDAIVPNFTTTQAGRVLKVNGTGTALEYGTVDLSGLIPLASRGVANGVASLDSTGKMPSAQLPSITLRDSIFGYQSGSLANQSYYAARIYGVIYRIYGIALKTSAGTCSVQVAVDGTTQSALGTYSAGTTQTQSLFTNNSFVEIDARNVSKRIELVVSSNAAATNLEWCLLVEVSA